MSKVGVLLWRHIFESGDAKRIAQQHPDISMLKFVKDLPYDSDGDQGHLFDIYRRKDGSKDDPVMINIHGGGLFASYKEVNAHFNYAIAKMGYTVVSLSYRRIPETDLWHQVSDIMKALRHIKAHAEELGINLKKLYLSGDSAGALLAFFALSLNKNEKLQGEFGILGADLDIKAAALISIMLETQRKDILFSLNSVVCSKEDKGKAYEKYLRKPSLMLQEGKLPPIVQFTSVEDMIRADSLEFNKLLERYGNTHELHDYAKGKERQLVHVFSVMYPDYPESIEVYNTMDAFFKKYEGE